jgi:hypothetical protein
MPRPVVSAAHISPSPQDGDFQMKLLECYALLIRLISSAISRMGLHYYTGRNMRALALRVDQHVYQSK